MDPEEQEDKVEMSPNPAHGQDVSAADFVVNHGGHGHQHDSAHDVGDEEEEDDEDEVCKLSHELLKIFGI